jgi:adenylate cyclase
MARLTQDPSPVTRADCPPELAQLVMRCLARAPDDRPQTAEAVLAELEAVPVVATGTDTGHAKRVRRARTVLIGALAATGLVAASLGAWQLMKTRADARLMPSTPGPAIAVLPVTTISSDPRDTVLAAGLTEELIATLSKAGNLRVSPTISVSALRERGLDVRQIAESLRVSHVLVSSMRKDGERLRFQVRLVDPRDGSARWSETYNRELDDIFAMQDDIARAVGREIGARLNTGRNGRLPPRRYTPSIVAYQAYVEGMQARLIDTPASRAEAIALLNRAIAIDSNFAAAYAGLAQVHMIAAGAVTRDYRKAFYQVRELALKAVALDDSLGEAHAALGWAQMSARSWTEAEVELKRAIELDPQAPRAFEGLARLYMYTGRPAEQLATARKGEELAPYTVSAVRELALALSVNGQCDEAIEALTPFRTLTPAVGVAGVVRGQCYAAMAKWPEAIAEFRWAMDNSDARTALAFLGYALARSGQRDEATAILRDLETGRKYSHGAFGIATLHAGLGNYDKAFIYLAKSVEENSIRIYLLGPMFAELRRDPRFADINRRMGL